MSILSPFLCICVGLLSRASGRICARVPWTATSSQHTYDSALANGYVVCVYRNKDSGVEGFPLRSWSIEVYLVNEHGEQVAANVFDKVTYTLHPSFGDRAVQVFKNPPFRIQEEGWGEFDMQIGLTAADKEHSVSHDLNFSQARYESKHVITFKNPKPALLAALRDSGPVPGDENGVKMKRSAGAEEGSKKKKRTEKNVDMDKLADGLQRLGEDDLLQVVQMVHDNKAPDSYTKND
ncbi:putative transcription initiation factor subunit (TAF30), partial [Aspergillus ochraceoroseus]